MALNKFLVAFLVILLSGFATFSQAFKGGVVAGLAATQVEGDGYGGYNKAGPIAGVWVQLPFSNRSYVETQLRYIQKGSFSRSSIDGVAVGFYRMRLHYIEMPYYVAFEIRRGIFISAGLSFGFLWQASEVNNLGAMPEEDITQFRRVELASRIGVEYIIDKKYSLGSSFCYSLLPVRPHKGNITYRLNQGQYNNVLELIFKIKL
jgi:hypothetical protein